VLKLFLGPLTPRTSVFLFFLQKKKNFLKNLKKSKIKKNLVYFLAVKKKKKFKKIFTIL